MKIFNSIDEINITEDTVVALGNFDGVHRGHRQIISKMVESAKRMKVKSAVFTFSNHPRNVIGKNPVKNIIYMDEKLTLLRRLGLEYVFNLPFDDDMRTRTADEYIKDLIVGKFRAKQVYCGFNYHFGYKAAGDIDMLKREGEKYGFKVFVNPPFTIDGVVVSSSEIRKLIEQGNMVKCNEFLGRPYDIGGEVVVGNKLGRTIGFPTANLMIDETMVTPANGVYVSFCIYKGMRYPAITNVGVKPTIGEYKKNIETHVFGLDKEIYGEQIRVEFIKKMRDEVKFDGIEALQKQIQSDCEDAKRFHERLKNRLF